MRVLGFLTGVGLLVGLFLLAGQVALFSDRGSPREDDIKSNSEKTTQKLADVKDVVVGQVNAIADTTDIKNDLENTSVTDITTQNGAKVTNEFAIDHSNLQVNSDTQADPPPPPLQTRLQPKTLVEAEPIQSTTKLGSILEQVTQAKPGSQENLELTTATAFELEPDQSTTASEPVVTVDPLVVEDTVQWHTFWGPFKTRNSAQGFTDYVAKQTGIEINIIVRKPGQYMVAYPYRTESDREAAALLIEERTALNISEN